MARFNKCANPSCANDSADWVHWPSSVQTFGPTRVTGLTVGTTGRTTGASTSVGAGTFSTSLESGPCATSALSTTWTVVGWILTTQAGTVRPEINRWNGSTFVDTVSAQTNQALVANTWTQIRFTFTTPGTGTFTAFRLAFDFPIAGTACTAQLAAVRMEQVTDAGMVFADGGTAGWTWDGTAGNSASTLPLEVDASSPARANGAATNGTVAVTTAAFNPPISVLVAAVQCNARIAPGPTGQVSSITMTNNGAALTWTTANLRHLGDSGGLRGCAAILMTPLAASRTGMTVTATINPTSVASDINTPSIKLYVVTGADLVTPLGGTTEGSSTTNAITTTAFTTVGASSLGVVSACEWNATGAVTSSDCTIDTFANTGVSVSTASGYKPLGAAGSSATFNLDAAGTGAAEWNWVSAEIVKAAAAAGPPVAGPPRVLSQAVNRASTY